MKQFLTQSVTLLILSFLSPAFLHAQIVTDERMFSFEEPQLPACVTGVRSQVNRTSYWNSGKSWSSKRKTRQGRTCIFPLSAYGYTMNSLRMLPSSLSFWKTAESVPLFLSASISKDGVRHGSAMNAICKGRRKREWTGSVSWLPMQKGAFSSIIWSLRQR